MNYTAIAQIGIAQTFYQAWLRSEMVDDPEARIEPNLSLGWRGVKGPERAAAEGKAYDVLPPEILVAINNAVQDVAAFLESNKKIAENLKHVSQGKSLAARLVS